MPLIGEGWQKKLIEARIDWITANPRAPYITIASMPRVFRLGSNHLSWRRPIASLNLLITSTVSREDHNRGEFTRRN
jgi:hypothetical protein